jgi:hypothetical protein
MSLGLSIPRFAAGDRDHSIVMTARAAQAVGVDDHLANVVLVNHVEAISNRDFEAFNQGIMQSLGKGFQVLGGFPAIQGDSGVRHGVTPQDFT